MRWLAVFLAMGMACGPARAADLAAATTPPPPGPAVSFTGCYVGGHGGGLWTRADDWIVRTPGGAFEGESLGGHGASGVAGGVQGGCDYQFGRGFVLGLQASHTWADADGSHPSARETGVTYSSSTDGVTLAGARLGYAWDGILAYVTGGAAWQQDDYAAATTQIGTAYTASETRVGWTVGVGGEVALTPVLSAFVAYDYLDLGTDRIGLTPAFPGLRPASVDIDTHTGLLRAGFNLRFRPGLLR